MIMDSPSSQHVYYFPSSQYVYFYVCVLYMCEHDGEREKSKESELYAMSYTTISYLLWADL